MPTKVVLSGKVTQGTTNTEENRLRGEASSHFVAASPEVSMEFEPELSRGTKRPAPDDAYD